MPTNLQLHTLRLYAELISRRETLAGTLTFAYGPGCTTTGLPAAVSIAGGTTLLVDPDKATVKSVFRTGGLDFIVNTLDEAVRVLKNEVRKHTPLSVALTAEPSPILAEMYDRGIQPDLEISFESSSYGLSSRPKSERSGDAAERPALALALAHLHLPPASLTLHAASWLAARKWTETWLPTETTADLRVLDTRLLEHLSEEDPRRLWLTRIAHYQRPSPNSGRATWLTPTEHAL